MSKITKFFKSSSESSSRHRSRAGPTPQEAIHKLRETEEMLTKKQEFLEKKIEQELMTAKKHGTKNKQGKMRPEIICNSLVDVLTRVKDQHCCCHYCIISP